MACDNLTHTISISKNTILIGETVTCTAIVTNNGTTTEKFHVVFTNDGSPLSTSTLQTIAPGATINIPVSFQGITAGTVSICSDMVCDTISTDAYVLSEHGILANGTDETAKLQTQLNAAASSGKSVVLFPSGGIIGVSDEIDFPGSMEYNGNGCTLKLLDDSDLIDKYGFYYVFNYYCGSNVYIHDMKFDGNKDKQYRPGSCNGTPLSSYYFPYCPNGGIYCNTDNFRFEYNEVKNYGSYMLEVLHGDNAIIAHNIIHDGWQYGITFSGSPSHMSNNGLIESNTIYRMGQCGMKIQGTSNTTIRNNIITMPARYDLFTSPSIGSQEPTGIRLYDESGSYPSNHITIINNTINGTGGNGERAIASDSSANSTITVTNNTLNTVYYGIQNNFSGTITGNIIKYTGTCMSSVVSGNTCTHV
jgi:hypothetical protein